MLVPGIYEHIVSEMPSPTASLSGDWIDASSGNVYGEPSVKSLNQSLIRLLNPPRALLNDDDDGAGDGCALPDDWLMGVNDVWGEYDFDMVWSILKIVG